jgi:hypothetical protein
MSNPLSVSWGEFLSQFSWDWYVTLTFDGDVKTFTAHNRCKAWLRALEKAAGHPIAWFRADEYGERFGKFHMHLLIANVAHIHRFTFMELWNQRNGFARIYPFDPRKGAAFYVSEYVSKQLGEWEISDNLEAFRTQQPVLPLTGQCGTGAAPGSRQAYYAPVQSRTASEAKQGLLSDFREPDLSEVDADEIRVSFREQTKRRT